jgi:hypothetical protein
MCGADLSDLEEEPITGTDENTEQSRVLQISRKNKLSQQAIAQVLDKLTVIEFGKW